MLLITRRTSESVIINGCIEVKIIDIRSNRVKLGFEFPSGNTVYRQELYAKIQEENQSAASIDVNSLGEILKTKKIGGTDKS